MTSPSREPLPTSHSADAPERHPVRNNWLALLSLAIALFGLGYNTWRNETTEQHRNVREASFMVLNTLAELQQLADSRFFGGDSSEANRIAIWGRVTLTRDSAMLVSQDAQARADTLFQTWSQQEKAFNDGDKNAEKAMAEAVRATRDQVLADLRQLR